MKRMLIAIGILILVASLAVPLMAHGPRWNQGHHMRGYWGNDRGSYCDYGKGFTDLSKEEQRQLKDLDSKFYNETDRLRYEIRSKSAELNSYLSSTNPDSQKLKALQRELSDLRSEMDEKRLAYELEARKILPESRFGGDYGKGFYGHHMRDYGPGMGFGKRGCLY